MFENYSTGVQTNALAAYVRVIATLSIRYIVISDILRLMSQIKIMLLNSKIRNWDFVLLFILLTPWVPYMFHSLSKKVLLFPTFGEDQTHYLSRLSAIWQGFGPGHALTPFGRNDFIVVDGFNTVLERMFFSMGELFGGNRMVFISYLTLTISICIFFMAKATRKLFAAILNPLNDYSIAPHTTATIFLFASFIISTQGIKPLHIPESIRFPVPLIHFIIIAYVLNGVITRTGKGFIRAMIVGVSSYIYFYTWIICLLLLFLSELHRLYVDRKYLITFKVFAVSIFVAAPTILSLINRQMNPTEMNRVVDFAFDLQNSHQPLWSSSLTFLLISSSFSFFCYRKNPNYRNFFLLNLLVFFTSFICFNQQVLTGKILQVGHFHWYFIYPFAATFCFIWALLFLSRLNRRLLIFVNTSIMFFALLVSTSTAINSNSSLRTTEVEKSVVAYKSLSSKLGSNTSRILVYDGILQRTLATNPGPRLVWHEFGIHYEQDVQDIYNVNNIIWMIKNRKSIPNVNSIRKSCINSMAIDCYSFFSLMGSSSKLERKEFEPLWESGETDSIIFEQFFQKRFSESIDFISEGNLTGWLRANNLNFVLFTNNEIDELASFPWFDDNLCSKLTEDFVLCSLPETLAAMVKFGKSPGQL